MWQVDMDVSILKNKTNKYKQTKMRVESELNKTMNIRIMVIRGVW